MDTIMRNPTSLSLGLFIARMVFGLLMAAHGAQKLFGWFGGYGLDGTGGFMESLGFRPGRRFAALAGAGEFTGGLLTALGLLGPVGPALMVAVMVVAIGSVHWKNGVFAAKNGVELPLLFAIAAVALALAGPGLYALDSAFGLAGTWTPGLSAAALAAGFLGGLASLAGRHPVTATAKA
jgi:putative oxidoreductase